MDYLRWLLLLSAAFALLERVRPQRPRQRPLRAGVLTDLCYLLFNGHFFAVLTAGVTVPLMAFVDGSLDTAGLLPANPFLAGRPAWVQFLVFLAVSDFLQWCVHVLLHKVPVLWKFHQVHHSVVDMDWAGNFRFHWMEIVIYRSLLYLPLLLLGGDPEILLAVAVFATAWGHFNHSNLDVSLGWAGRILNSPRMHLWHHDRSPEGGPAKNFGIVFSLWDYLFGTVYWPQERPPRELGYPGMETMPRDFLHQLAWPLVRRRVDSAAP
jgi:sterol desaturase/sphingolipid hydroxylase (fatty acid hydroxylase superfamily)